jgi:hypothetical protein
VRKSRRIFAAAAKRKKNEGSRLASGDDDGEAFGQAKAFTNELRGQNVGF